MTARALDERQFIRTVAQWAGTDEETAAGATRATLETLARRITKGQSLEIARQLPDGIAPLLHTDGHVEPMSVDEFVARVADREGVDPSTVERHAMAVFAALRRFVDGKEYRDLAEELPDDFAPLLDPAVEKMTADDVRAAVAAEAGLDSEAAGRALDAVLETLAQRIAPGEVDDLISRLPVAWHEPLKRGRAASDDRTRRMTADEFHARVAKRQGTSLEDARRRTRAVFAVLREAVQDDEYFDVTVQLPPALSH